jgi:cellulose synthase (UDP-forming)
MKAPGFKQKLNLRTMIVIGLGLMIIFLYNLLQPQVMGNTTLYWLLMTTFIFTFFKIGYEWYHYWSISIPEKPALSRQYTVDVFTTFCAGEPYEMIEQTLRAIKNISYPHQTYLCDEADDVYLKALCQELDIHHVTRTFKINAKAGNINHALQQSNGELCVVLDPDHVPAANFLDRVVGYFENDQMGYVQVVQAYYNQEDSWVAKGAAQQTYQFYGPMMMCMNSYGTVQAIGANCTFRRTALESIGGHAAGLAEDMHTAMQLHAQGWKSMYVPEI